MYLGKYITNSSRQVEWRFLSGRGRNGAKVFSPSYASVNQKTTTVNKYMCQTHFISLGPYTNIETINQTGNSGRSLWEAWVRTCLWYPTGQIYSLELMFETVKVAKNLNPPRLRSNRCLRPGNNNGECYTGVKWLPHMGFDPLSYLKNSFLGTKNTK